MNMPEKANPTTTQVNVEEITRNLPAYLRLVEAGETVLIVKAGKPMAEIKPPLPPAASPRPYGLCTGEFVVPDDFDAPLAESIIAEFEGA
jgi:antitoxin (DNA-binding transcriptional repressor) of toxin-antitoxin stability system